MNAPSVLAPPATMTAGVGGRAVREPTGAGGKVVSLSSNVMWDEHTVCPSCR